MIVARSLRAIRRSVVCGSAVTIGVFDGIHIGHKAVIGRAIEASRKNGLVSAVLTFDPHPLKLINPSSNVPNLISLDHRIRLIENMGADLTVVLDFTKPVSRLSPEDFVSDILIEGMNAKEIYVGENFFFGRNAEAGTRELAEIAGRYGVKVEVVRPVRRLGVIVSSSAIRRLILNGNIGKAALFLGRPVSVLGTVVKGISLARELGFPTANINPHHEVVPPGGVYAVRVKVADTLKKGVVNIGLRPTFYSSRDLEPTIEVHIFDFNERIYDQDLEVLFIKKLRDEKRFDDKKALIRQIRQDARNALLALI